MKIRSNITEYPMLPAGLALTTLKDYADYTSCSSNRKMASSMNYTAFK